MQNNMELIPEFQTLVDKAKERNAGKPMRIAIAGADAENILEIIRKSSRRSKNSGFRTASSIFSRSAMIQTLSSTPSR